MEKPNINYIKELSEGDVSFERKIITTLQKEIPKEYEDFLRNFKKKDFKKTADSVHKLKHKISILGLVKSYELASEFEIDLRIHQKVKLYESFKKILETIVDFIKPL